MTWLYYPVYYARFLSNLVALNLLFLLNGFFIALLTIVEFQRFLKILRKQCLPLMQKYEGQTR